MTDTVIHDAEGSRYVLLRDGDPIGKAEYETREDGSIVFVHTEVDASLERGLGSKLIGGALDDVRQRTSARVEATCPFALRFLDTHPEYQDLTTR